MEDNKLSETDTEETPQIDVLSEEELEEEFGESEVGEENVTSSEPKVEPKVEPEVKKEEETFLTKEELETLVGREIKDKEDFSKHYTNLKGFVGKKKEVKKEPSDNAGVMEKLNKIEFLGDNPDAKEYYDDLIKPLADGKGLSLEDAYKSVNPYIEATKAKNKEKNIGVESKNRINPARDKKIQALAEKARAGDETAQDAYIKANLGKYGFKTE